MGADELLPVIEKRLLRSLWLDATCPGWGDAAGASARVGTDSGAAWGMASLSRVCSLLPERGVVARGDGFASCPPAALKSRSGCEKTSR